MDVSPNQPPPNRPASAAHADDVADPVIDGAPSQLDGVDRDTDVESLLERATALLEVPLAERADAFDELNSDVAGALRAIEDA